MITGNINGIKKIILERLENLYELTVSVKESPPISG